MKKVILIVSFFFVVFSMGSTLLAVPADKTITWEGSGQGQVVFEGDEHAEKGYKCNACHPSLFQMKKSSAKITLASHTNGQFCSACHNGNTAFGADNPEKCHECHTGGKQRHRHREKGKHHD
jgi:c(7)-type cytochrome triheme protein